MRVDPRTEAWVRLQVAGIAPRTLVEWLRAFGGPEAVFAARNSARRAALTKVGADGAIAPDNARVASALAFLETPGASLVAWDDADYPQALFEIADPPPVFYCRGNRELLSRPSLAIVGSRNATAQGRADAEAFGAALAERGLTIVSGLALGIDAAAHRGALAHPASSVAVIGTGPDRVYPAKNRALALELAARGAIISEFAPGTPPLRENFPRRNRLISGLARGVLVVEATLSSGSLVTARFAAEQGREVFALPGSIHSPLSKGCHRLIRDGAKLVETAEDILVELGMPAPGASDARAVVAGRRFDGEAQSVLAALGHAPADIDALVARSGLPAAAVVAALTELELAGAAASVAGGLWQSVIVSTD